MNFLWDFILVKLDIWIYFWVFIVAFLFGVIGAGWWMLRYLPDKHDILSFEMTFSVEKMKSILTDWYSPDKDKNQIPIVITNTCLDYIWLISYTLVLFSLCAIIAISLRGIDTSLMSAYIATHFGCLALVAGALDAIENAFLVWLLIKNKNGISDNSVGVIPVMGASIAAVIKFIIVSIVVFFIILAVITISAIKLGLIMSILLLFVLIVLLLIFVMILKTTGGK